MNESGQREHIKTHQTYGKAKQYQPASIWEERSEAIGTLESVVSPTMKTSGGNPSVVAIMVMQGSTDIS